MRSHNKLPRVDAFAYYVSLGTERSYQSVADHFGVSKNAVNKAAKRECWMERLRAIEEAARQRSDEQLAETMAEMRTRQLKVLRAVHQRALEGLRDHRLSTCMEAVKAVEAAIKLEREILADPLPEPHGKDAERERRESDEFLVDEGTSEQEELTDEDDGWPID